MSKSEINGLVIWGSSGNRRGWMPCGLNLFNKLWWQFVPGVIINVKWPKGWVVLYEHPDGSKVSTESADPNEHYRPSLEKLVGKQGWDWQWGMGDKDASENRLTIKIRKKYAKQATLFALKWA